MIVSKELNKEYASKEEMLKALVENKGSIIAQKKMITKEADTVSFSVNNNVAKNNNVAANTSKISAKLVINTTNVMDSHSDVHLKGIWNKSLKEQKNLYLLQEHQMKFDKIISDEVKASVDVMSFRDLGSNLQGTTEALIFDVGIDKRNAFMFGQYAKGYVKNHSVGMRYVKIDMAVNSDDKWATEEKEVWDKHIDEIANKEQAEELGYFFAVSEAKIIEGSAVPIGSNTITPTLNTEAVKDTSTEAAVKHFDLSNAIKQININL